MKELKKIGLWLVLLWMGHQSMVAQQSADRLRIMEYNVENLFDTIDNPEKLDDDFLPTGKYQWTEARYRGKLGRLARVIACAGVMTPPEIVVLTEVESDTALTDLTRRTALVRCGYEYVMTHSADKRGINVGLLYQPMKFSPLVVESFRIPYIQGKERPTRDILHVAGLTVTGDTLDVFGVHMPSRRGGPRLTDPYRIRGNELLRSKVDSVLRRRAVPSVIITGDFNDGYDNRSLQEGLRVKLPHKNIDREQLYILTAHPKAAHGVKGTYKWRGEWNELDQMVVNGAMLEKRKGWRTSLNNCRIFVMPMLLQDDKHQSVKPYRTYQGPFYKGGYSDHLPLLIDLYVGK